MFMNPADKGNSLLVILNSNVALFTIEFVEVYEC